MGPPERGQKTEKRAGGGTFMENIQRWRGDGGAGKRIPVGSPWHGEGKILVSFYDVKERVA
jgi:hypothetical protein